MTVTTFLTVVAVAGWAALVWHVELGGVLHRLVSTADETIPELEFRKEVVAHASFYGAAVAAFLGLGQSWLGYVAAAFWFLCALAYARAITLKIAEAEEHEQKLAHRRACGATRSIVRDELGKGGLARPGPNLEKRGERPYTGVNANAT